MLILRRSGAAGVVGVVLVIGLVLLVLKWALITMAVLAVPFGIWWAHDHGATRKQHVQRAGAAQRRRAQIEALASVDAAGGCGWCGSRLAHADRRGRLVMPRDWHRTEIEGILRREGLTAPVSAAR